jgi:DNA polymerase alpha subunit B
MANIALEKDLEAEFSDVGIDIDGELAALEKLCELCSKHNLTAEQMVAQWVSFGVRMKCMQDVTLDHLADFEKQQLLSSSVKKSKTPARRPHQQQQDWRSNSSYQKPAPMEDDQEDGFMGAYASKTPQGKASLKRRHTTPEEMKNKRFQSLQATPSVFSPASLQSPVGSSTPGQKYSARASRGDIVASHGISMTETVQWKTKSSGGENITIASYNENCNVKSSYKYMFQKLQDKADVLNDTLNSLAEEMQETIMLDEYDSVANQGQDDLTFAGRICCDSNGRLNAKSVLLEGSRETSGGKRIPLDLSSVANYSIFPGQITAVQGKNPGGDKIYATTVYSGSKLPFHAAAKKITQLNQTPFTMYIACGPFV